MLTSPPPFEAATLHPVWAVSLEVLEEAITEVVVEALQQHRQEEHRPRQGKGPGATSDVHEEDHGRPAGLKALAWAPLERSRNIGEETEPSPELGSEQGSLSVLGPRRG